MSRRTLLFCLLLCLSSGPAIALPLFTDPGIHLAGTDQFTSLTQGISSDTPEVWNRWRRLGKNGDTGGPFALVHPQKTIVVYVSRFRNLGGEADPSDFPERLKKAMTNETLVLVKSRSIKTQGLGKVAHLSLKDSAQPDVAVEHLVALGETRGRDFYFLISIVYQGKDRESALSLTQKILAESRIDAGI